MNWNFIDWHFENHLNGILGNLVQYKIGSRVEQSSVIFVEAFQGRNYLNPLR